MKKPDLLILVAIWEFIAAFLAFAGLLVIAFVALAAAVSEADRAAAAFFFSFGAIVLIVFVALSIAGGIGLLSGKEWGRIISIIQAAISVLNIPVGTVIGILILIYLTRSDVRDYFKPPSST